MTLTGETAVTAVQTAVQIPFVSEPARWWILCVSGELDLSTAPGLHRLAYALRRGDKTSGLVVDLEEVTFMDCAGLRPILRAHRALPTGWFFVRNPHVQVSRLLQLTRLDVSLPIVRDHSQVGDVVRHCLGGRPKS